MKVLVACEFSGVVRDAFIRCGHEAWSCDLEGIEPEGEYKNYHWYGDCRELIRQSPYGKFDLMIAHPPCTYLCNSGVRWLYGGKGTTPDKARMEKFRDAAQFFIELQKVPIERIAIENPIPHNRAKQWVGNYSQIIQPWQFGHGEIKATCLWLKNLPLLVPTDIVDGRTPRVHYASPGPERWKERSRTLPGIAKAMAEQWGNNY